jgi:hypothetical protein
MKTAIQFTYIETIPGAHDLTKGRKIGKKHLETKDKIRNRRSRAKATLQYLALKYKNTRKDEKRRKKSGSKPRKKKANSSQWKDRAVKVYNYGTELTKRYARGIREGKLAAKADPEDPFMHDKPTAKAIKFSHPDNRGEHKKRKPKKKEDEYVVDMHSRSRIPYPRVNMTSPKLRLRGRMRGR